jgi:hypothetical protein
MAVTATLKKCVRPVQLSLPHFLCTTFTYPGTYSDFPHTLNYIRAGYPGLYLVSHEEQRVALEMTRIAQELKYNLVFWSVVDGLVDTQKGTNNSANDPLEALIAIRDLKEKTLILLRDFHQFLQDPNPILNPCSVAEEVDMFANSVKPRWVSPSSSRLRQMRRPRFWRKRRLNARRFIWRLMLMEQTRLIQVLNHLQALLSTEGILLTTKEAKEFNPPPPQQQNRPRLLAAQNRVLSCLGDAELDHPFCSNLDGLAGCRISTHASFAIHQNDLAQPRNREGVLRIFICQCD